MIVYIDSINLFVTRTICNAVFCFMNIEIMNIPQIPRDKTLSIVVNEMNNAVICFDINNECVYANERALKIFNSSLDSLSGISEDVQGWIKEHDTNNSASLEWSGQTLSLIHISEPTRPY